MVIPETKLYACATCKLEMIPESEVEEHAELTLSGYMITFKIHKKCGSQVTEFDWRKH